ncbi:MAG: glycosyltransferase [Acidobacteriota bacterium]|nr:glycosyltransferase [Acidobacteriota bacterium]
MNITVFGLSISSAWGNGHATLLRGLFHALHRMGHRIDFFELDVPYYAAHRDAISLPYASLHLYSDWRQNQQLAKRLLGDADVAIVTSYCPDGAAACELIREVKHPLRRVFYDMDTPVTLKHLGGNEPVSYLPPDGLADFDLLLSYTGGKVLGEIKHKLRAPHVATLYGWVDPDVYYRVPVCKDYASNLSYLGTYAPDRQQALDDLLIKPAQRLRDREFIIAGAMYPDAGEWPSNIRHFSHIAPPQHSAFYSSSPLTLSVTRGVMASMGFCPSGRLFEAAACGTAVLSDWWEGLDLFFEPGTEILIANSTADALSALSIDDGALLGIGVRARERALDCHTAKERARRLISLIETPSDAAKEYSLTPAISAAEPA